MKRIALLALASLALASCQTLTSEIPTAPSTAPVPSGSTAISAAAQKALYTAEVAYNVPAQAYVTLNRAGKLPPDVKAKAKPLLLQAYRALTLARQAAAAGDTVGVMLHAGDAQGLVTQAAALLPQH